MFSGTVDAEWLRQAEVEELDRAVPSANTLAGLQVAMPDAALVRRLESFGHLPRNRECLVERHRTSRNAP